MLVEAGEITPVQLAEAIELQKEGKERLGQILVRMGAVSEKAVGEAVAGQLGLQYVDLDDVLPEEQALLALPEHLARRYQVIPLRQNNGKLRVGMVDPLDVIALDDIRRHTGQEIETVVISPGGFQRVLPQYPALDENVQAMISILDRMA